MDGEQLDKLIEIGLYIFAASGGSAWLAASLPQGKPGGPLDMLRRFLLNPAGGNMGNARNTSTNQ